MELLFYLCLTVIYGCIILAHSWGFWSVYQSPFGEQPGFSAMGKGAMAGSAGWFWLCFFSVIWSWNSGSGLVLVMWFYGLLIVPVIGMLLTGLYYWIISKLKLEIGFWSRAFLGLTITFFIGVILGSILDYNSHHNGSVVGFFVVIFMPIGAASGIMAGEPQLNDYRET